MSPRKIITTRLPSLTARSLTFVRFRRLSLVLSFCVHSFYQARTAIRNMFLGLRERESQLLIPWATYTEPEIAHVGLYEKEMEERGIESVFY